MVRRMKLEKDTVHAGCFDRVARPLALLGLYVATERTPPTAPATIASRGACSRRTGWLLVSTVRRTDVLCTGPGPGTVAQAQAGFGPPRVRVVIEMVR